MTKYIAFLKGLNVSGQKAIKISELNDLFKKIGLQKVITNIESGNVLFESDNIELSDTMEREIKKKFGYDITVIIKTIEEVKEIMSEKPFKDVEKKSNIRMYITFLNAKPTNEYTLPIMSAKNDIEVFKISSGIALSIGEELNGTYYSPNSFIERELGVVAATRNWSVIKKLLK